MGTFYNKKMFSLFHLCFGSIIAIHIFAVSGLRFPSHSISVYRRFQCRFRLFRTCNLKHLGVALFFNICPENMYRPARRTATKTYIWKQDYVLNERKEILILSHVAGKHIYIYIPNSMQYCNQQHNIFLSACSPAAIETHTQTHNISLNPRLQCVRALTSDFRACARSITTKNRFCWESCQCTEWRY